MQETVNIVTSWVCRCGRRYKAIGEADVLVHHVTTSKVSCSTCKHVQKVIGQLVSLQEEVKEGVWVRP